MEAIHPKKIGVVFKPPALVLLYKDKLQHKKRTMPIRELTGSCDCGQLASRLKSRHKAYLASISVIIIEKLIRLAQESLKGTDKQESLNIIRKEYEIDPGEDLNKLSDKELKKRKEIMDLAFDKNSIGKEHPEFVYDKVVEFSKATRATEWDSNSDSTPVNSPQHRLKVMMASSKDMFGLDSPAEEEEDSASETPAPAQPPEPPAKEFSAGEDEEGEEEDDFW